MLLDYNLAVRYYNLKNYVVSYKLFNNLLEFEMDHNGMLAIYMYKILTKVVVRNEIFEFSKKVEIPIKGLLDNIEILCIFLGKGNDEQQYCAIKYGLKIVSEISIDGMIAIGKFYFDTAYPKLLKLMYKHKLYNILQTCLRINGTEFIIAKHSFCNWLCSLELDHVAIDLLRTFSVNKYLIATITLANYFKAKRSIEYVKYAIDIYNYTNDYKYKKIALRYALLHKFYTEYCKYEENINMKEFCILQEGQKTECPICYDNTTCHTLMCNHNVCNSCLQSSIANNIVNCPCCRKELEFKVDELKYICLNQ